MLHTCVTRQDSRVKCEKKQGLKGVVHPRGGKPYLLTARFSQNIAILVDGVALEPLNELVQAVAHLQKQLH